MNISGGQVRYGEADEGRLRVGAANADTVVTMTPHVMIWPLPVDPQVAELPETYHVSDPPHQWIMAAGTPVAHMHVHFSETTASALRKIPPSSEDAMLQTASAWAQGDFQSGHFETSSLRQ